MIHVSLYWLYYRIDFDLLSSSVTADNHPELLQQLEKLKALADRLQESEVGISQAISNKTVFQIVTFWRWIMLMIENDCFGPSTTISFYIHKLR